MCNESFIVYNSAGRKSTREYNYFNRIVSDPFRELSTTLKISWAKIHFYNLTSVAYSYEKGHPAVDKYMLQETIDCA